MKEEGGASVLCFLFSGVCTTTSSVFQVILRGHGCKEKKIGHPGHTIVARARESSLAIYLSFNLVVTRREDNPTTGCQSNALDERNSLGSTLIIYISLY